MSQRPPRESRYNRPRRALSSVSLIIGLLLGVVGGLFYAWMVNPRPQTDTAPWQLNPQDRAQYMAAIALSFAEDSDLGRTVQRLIELHPRNGDPFQEMADTACQLATTGFVDTTSGLRAVEAMRRLYTLQGKSGCADTLIPAEVQSTPEVQIIPPTPTPLPPPSKTPTPESLSPVTATPTRLAAPTFEPQADFQPPFIRTFCDKDLSGIIEVFVQDYNGEGVPGVEVRVRWDDGGNTFFTGLKPERGPGYADFQMTLGLGYTIDLPNRSDPSTAPLVADPCTTDTGVSAITSFRVFFRKS